MPSRFGRLGGDVRMGEQQESGLMRFACETCGSPAITMPEEFHDRAPVLCRGCGGLLATWGMFKQKTTQVILSEIRQGAGSIGFGSDPLDEDLLRMGSVGLRS